MPSQRENNVKKFYKKLLPVRCLLMDVDGVLTDGKIIVTGGGVELKNFSVIDGMGLGLAKRAGMHVAWISGRFSKPTEARAKEFGFPVFQKAGKKLSVYESVLKEKGFSDGQVCYIGDDINDIPVLRRCGFSVAVKNAMEEVKKEADYVTKKSGGEGAVREVIEMILKAQNKWEQLKASF